MPPVRVFASAVPVLVRVDVLVVPVPVQAVVRAARVLVRAAAPAHVPGVAQAVVEAAPGHAPVTAARIVQLVQDAGRKRDRGDNTKEIFIYGSDRCNLACPYCLNRNTNYEGNLTTVAGSLDSVLRATAEPEVAVSISGGEPLYHWEYLETLQSVLRKHPKKYRFTLYTNGTLLNQESYHRAEALFPGTRFMIGLDSTYKPVENLADKKRLLEFLGQRVSYIYVIADRNDVSNLKTNLMKLSDLAGNLRSVLIDYNRNQMEDIPYVYKSIGEQLKGTEFIPWMHTCKDVNKEWCRYITPDGKVRTCKEKMRHGLSISDIDKFHKYFCSVCRYERFCRNCGVYLANGYHNNCLLTRSLCVNLKEESK